MYFQKVKSAKGNVLRACVASSLCVNGSDKRGTVTCCKTDCHKNTNHSHQSLGNLSVDEKCYFLKNILNFNFGEYKRYAKLYS